MNHLLLAPILVPAITAVFLLLSARRDFALHRAASLLSMLAQVGLAAWLVANAGTGTHALYPLGNWPVPFGIVLAVDRLSATMVLLTAVVGLGAALASLQGEDRRGRNFHALLHFQLMGLCGAFLTGDIFNLFVFFEILLIASYGLLLHGGGQARVRAGLHYVLINLTGSALFIAALGLVYGSLGTLNMADLADRVAQRPAEELPLVRAAGLLLLVVFSLKAAALPLFLWLPRAYAAASAPVASLFAIMTKVGVYSILRVHPLLFGTEAGALAGLAQPWLLGGGLATLLLASLGALAQPTLRGLLSWLVIASVGTLLIGLGMGTQAALAGSVYYLVHSTLTMAAFFLLADVILRGRTHHGDTLVPDLPPRHVGLVGALFFVLAMAAAGLPPLSGFVGKAMILLAAAPHAAVGPIFLVVLVGGLAGLIGLSRAGSQLFWKPVEGGYADPAAAAEPMPAALFAGIGLHLTLIVLMVVFAGPLWTWADATAAQVLDARGYIDAILPDAPPSLPAPGATYGH